MGFSLLELLILLGLLATTGISISPIYHQWLRNQRLAVKAKEFLELLQFARASALYQMTDILVSEETSSSANQKPVWSVKTTEGHVLKIYSGLYPNQCISMNHLNHSSIIKFSSEGTSFGYNGRVILSDWVSKTEKVIWISPTGRVRLGPPI